MSKRQVMLELVDEGDGNGWHFGRRKWAGEATEEDAGELEKILETGRDILSVATQEEGIYTVKIIVKNLGENKRAVLGAITDKAPLDREADRLTTEVVQGGGGMLN